MLLRQQLHISQDLNNIYWSTARKNENPECNTFSKAAAISYPFNICAFEESPAPLKDFTRAISFFSSSYTQIFSQVVHRKKKKNQPQTTTSNKQTQQRYGLVRKLFGIFLFLVFIINMPLHLQKLLVQDLCNCGVKGSCFSKSKDQKLIEI